MSAIPKPLLTAQQYLALERAAPFKSEFYRGEIFAMAGAREDHNLIAGNLMISIGGQLRGRTCRAYPSDMRIHISANGLYTYPDLSALCGQPKFEDDVRDTLLNPSVVFEVLSKSTAAYDRGEKFKLYQSLASLQEYVLVSQDKTLIECFKRQSSGDWLYTSIDQPQQSLRLDSIDCALNVAEVYDKVEFER